jgi:deoxyadenosine/deoxycytidine kinase
MRPFEKFDLSKYTQDYDTMYGNYYENDDYAHIDFDRVDYRKRNKSLGRVKSRKQAHRFAEY